jgi:hypothetical protein
VRCRRIAHRLERQILAVRQNISARTADTVSLNSSPIANSTETNSLSCVLVHDMATSPQELLHRCLVSGRLQRTGDDRRSPGCLGRSIG